MLGWKTWGNLDSEKKIISHFNMTVDRLNRDYTSLVDLLMQNGSIFLNPFDKTQELDLYNIH
jgi:hypothetical protein